MGVSGVVYLNPCGVKQVQQYMLPHGYACGDQVRLRAPGIGQVHIST